MKKHYCKTKFSTISLIILLTISTIIIAIPNVSAQNLIMNARQSGIVNFPVAIDLNGPNTQLEGIKFAYKPPGATEFIITTDPPVETFYTGDPYVTETGGDLDIQWTPTQVGEYEVK